MMDKKEYSDKTRTLQSAGETVRMVGPYRILQKLGEGGMGEVWVAEQHKPIHRRVALKLIKAGMDTKQVIARFEAERQALAMMDHPAIAKVFEAGETDEGRPYFVMEYVQGIPITTHCDQNRLTTPERLELFMHVCEGVQHAHQKAIIHRDLKPSNILVVIQDGIAMPKIIDFGVAKATAQSLTERTMYTELGVLIGTPEYMSPEQAEMSGQNVDTRTDVYSLGAILYELLVGALPFDPKELRRAGFDEIRRKIRQEDPPKPSAKLSTMGDASTIQAEIRRTERPTLIRQIRGDLDWITMKALEKDRTRRYGSPSELAADIDRYLNHQPIVARPPSGLYKTKKFIRRHRVGVGVASTLAILLVTFSITTAIQARRIARERDRANQEAEVSRQVSDFLTGLFKVSDPSEARGNSITAREILDKGAKSISEAMKSQPVLQSKMTSTIGEVYTNLGLYKEAEPLLVGALTTQRRIQGNAHPETLSSIHKLANLYWYQNRKEDSERLYDELVEIRKRVLGKDHPDTLRADYDLASLYWARGQLDKAVGLAQETLEAQRRVLPEDHPDIINSIANLSSFYYAQERYKDALPLNEEAVALGVRVLGKDHPDTLLSMFNLATIYEKLEMFDRAESLYMSSIEGQRRVLGDEHPITIKSTSALANMYIHLKRYDEAKKLLTEALMTYKAKLGDENENTRMTLMQLITVLKNEGDYSGAEGLLGQALATIRTQYGKERLSIAWLLQGLGLLRSERGHTEAISLLREAVGLCRKLAPEDSVQMAMAEGDLGLGLLNLKRFKEAEPLLLNYLSWTKDNYGGKSDSASKAMMKNALGPLIRLYEGQADPEKANEYRAILQNIEKGKK
jgi:serine/threonine protein kinase